jgi:hypothetical protein
LKIEPSETLKIKIATDGYQNIKSKGENILNVTFTSINDKNYCKSRIGNFKLGLFRLIKEDHECLSKCLKEIFEQLEQISEIEINQKIYKIEYLLGGDYKNQLLIMGINAANSKFSCLYCTENKKDFWKNSSIINRLYQNALVFCKKKTKND